MSIREFPFGSWHAIWPAVAMMDCKLQLWAKTNPFFHKLYQSNTLLQQLEKSILQLGLAWSKNRTFRGCEEAPGQESGKSLSTRLWGTEDV